jgi:hypothetical protein
LQMKLQKKIITLVMLVKIIKIDFKSKAIKTNFDKLRYS